MPNTSELPERFKKVPDKPEWLERVEERSDEVLKFHKERNSPKESAKDKFNRIEKASKAVEETAEERHRKLLGLEKENH